MNFINQEILQMNALISMCPKARAQWLFSSLWVKLCRHLSMILKMLLAWSGWRIKFFHLVKTPGRSWKHQADIIKTGPNQRYYSYWDNGRMEMNETSKIGSSMLSIYDKMHNKFDVKWNYSALKCKKGSIQKSLLFLNEAGCSIPC